MRDCLSLGHASCLLSAEWVLSGAMIVFLSYHGHQNGSWHIGTFIGQSLSGARLKVRMEKSNPPKQQTLGTKEGVISQRRGPSAFSRRANLIYYYVPVYRVSKYLTEALEQKNWSSPHIWEIYHFIFLLSIESIK